MQLILNLLYFHLMIVDNNKQLCNYRSVQLIKTAHIVKKLQIINNYRQIMELHITQNINQSSYSNISQKQSSTMTFIDTFEAALRKNNSNKQNMPTNNVQSHSQKKLLKISYQHPYRLALNKKCQTLISSRVRQNSINFVQQQKKCESACLKCQKLQKVIQQGELKTIQIQNKGQAKITKLQFENEQNKKMIIKSNKTEINNRIQAQMTLQRQIKALQMKNEHLNNLLSRQQTRRKQQGIELKQKHQRLLTQKQKQSQQQKRNYQTKLAALHYKFQTYFATILSNSQYNIKQLNECNKDKDYQIQRLRTQLSQLNTFYQSLIRQKSQSYQLMRIRINQQSYKQLKQLQNQCEGKLKVLQAQNNKLMEAIKLKNQHFQSIQHSYISIKQSLQLQNDKFFKQNEDLRQKMFQIQKLHEYENKLRKTVQNAVNIDAMHTLQHIHNNKTSVLQSKFKFISSKLQTQSVKLHQLQRTNTNLKKQIKQAMQSTNDKQTQLINQIQTLSMENTDLVIKVNQLTNCIDKMQTHTNVDQYKLRQVQLLKELVSKNQEEYENQRQNLIVQIDNYRKQCAKVKELYKQGQSQLVKAEQTIKLIKSQLSNAKQQSQSTENKNQLIQEKLKQLQLQLFLKQTQLSSITNKNKEAATKNAQLVQQLSVNKAYIDQLSGQKLLIQQQLQSNIKQIEVLQNQILQFGQIAQKQIKQKRRDKDNQIKQKIEELKTTIVEMQDQRVNLLQLNEQYKMKIQLQNELLGQYVARCINS